MRRLFPPLLILGCLLALVLAFYGRALLYGEQFGYRDAAHFYYPLYQRVQAEWEAGRWPLWEPEENAGMPLLGNPTAAVLYPGKLIYALLPYAWGARLYAVAHSVLAFIGMFALLRGWGVSGTGSALGGLSYAFGGPIVFQYCNIIYLVGAAWIPFGFRAVDRWLRLGRRLALLELAAVLALQTLGGDPESAYLIGLCAGGYALGLARVRQRPEGARRPAWPLAPAALALVVVWVVVTLELAARLPALRPPKRGDLPPLPFPWMPWVGRAVLLGWGAAGVSLLSRWWRRGRTTVLVPMLAGLGGAAVLGGGLAAAQLLPVLEFTAQSGRAAGSGPHDVFPFSLEPIRVAEFAWPNVFGTQFAGNRSWLTLLPPTRARAKVWVPTLYVGGLTLVLALGTIGFRGGPPGRAWLSAIAVASLLASFGEYGGPIWWARWRPSYAARIGPHDPAEGTAIRLDGKLRNGDGSLYGLLATGLPGFRQFRFPSKLLTFTAVALAGLAGIGWDRLAAGRARQTLPVGATLLVVTLTALAGVLGNGARIVARFEAQPAAKFAGGFGPFDAAGAVAELRAALVQSSIVFAAAVVVIVLARRRPAVAGALALVLMSADLAQANSRFVLTVPQRLFEAEPKAVALLAEAERADPAPGPYRVHRMPIWSPPGWNQAGSTDRVRDFVAWERDTIQPKYGINLGIHYTTTLGVAELYDYEWFFGGFLRGIDDQMARTLNAQPGQKVVVYPRRAFDLWGSRYFLVPGHPAGWADEHRGFAAFLGNSERLYPPDSLFRGPDTLERQKDWLLREDFQVFRNKTAYPRAWVVHSARFIAPIVGLDRTDRDRPMQEILYSADPLWFEPGRNVFDPRTLAWIDSDRHADLARFLPGNPTPASERVTVRYPNPCRVELDATLERPGLVVLADVYYPGWKLAIDGKDAPIYRANRLMRGAAVESGAHHLVFTYEPDTFRRGGRISLAALGAFAILGVACVARPVARGLLPRAGDLIE